MLKALAIAVLLLLAVLAFLITFFMGACWWEHQESEIELIEDEKRYWEARNGKEEES